MAPLIIVVLFFSAEQITEDYEFHIISNVCYFMLLRMVGSESCQIF